MGLIKPPPDPAKRKKRLWIGLGVLLIVVIIVVLAVALTLTLNNNSSGSETNNVSGTSGSGKYWPGWDGINHLAVFGDSMTSVGFNVNGTLPSEANPIGNPDFPGQTSSIGENWVGFLTGTYNTSFIRTIDLAGGGATVDADLFKSKFPLMRSFEDQVLEYWIPGYVKNKPSQFQWKADDTLFAIFFGLNDVRDAFFNSKADLLGKDIERYIELLGDLYKAGARNFLLLALTPLERAPSVEWSDPERKRELGDLINKYNADLAPAVSQFSNDNPDAKVFLFDTHELYQQLLDDPCSYKETCPIQNTTNFCPAYANERQDPFIDDPACGYPLDKYFWINGLHPIYRVHNATAQAIVDYLDDKS